MKLFVKFENIFIDFYRCDRADSFHGVGQLIISHTYDILILSSFEQLIAN